MGLFNTAALCTAIAAICGFADSDDEGQQRQSQEGSRISSEVQRSARPRKLQRRAPYVQKQPATANASAPLVEERHLYDWTHTQRSAPAPVPHEQPTYYARETSLYTHQPSMDVQPTGTSIHIPKPITPAVRARELAPTPQASVPPSPRREDPVPAPFDHPRQPISCPPILSAQTSSTATALGEHRSYANPYPTPSAKWTPPPRDFLEHPPPVPSNSSPQLKTETYDATPPVTSELKLAEMIRQRAREEGDLRKAAAQKLKIMGSHTKGTVDARRWRTHKRVLQEEVRKRGKEENRLNEEASAMIFAGDSCFPWGHSNILTS